MTIVPPAPVVGPQCLDDGLWGVNLWVLEWRWKLWCDLRLPSLRVTNVRTLIIQTNKVNKGYVGVIVANNRNHID